MAKELPEKLPGLQVYVDNPLAVKVPELPEHNTVELELVVNVGVIPPVIVTATESEQAPLVQINL
jgi:hypothetical protein